MSAVGGPKIVTDNLILCLNAADKKSYSGSGTTWYDRSGDGHNGTLTNGPTFSDANGGSIVFDGDDDHVVWDTLAAVKWQNWSSITIETVFKLVSYSGASGGSAGRQYIFDYRDNGGVNGAMGLFHDSGGTTGLKLFYNTSGTSYEQPVITTFSLGDLICHQVTFDKTHSTNNIRHYINGVNVLTKSISITSTTTNSGKVWLARYSGGNYDFNGNIYSHTVYNRALTSAEVLQNFNAVRSRFNLSLV